MSTVWQPAIVLVAVAAIASSALAQQPMPSDVVRLYRENPSRFAGIIACGFGLEPTNESPPVAGRIVRVRRNFAEISLGSDDGLAVGHKLEVRCDGELRGTVIVRRVDPDRSVVEVEHGRRRPVLEAGGHVMSPVKPPDAKSLR